MKTIGCFHAHHSNIELVEQALSSYDVECVHFVDPGLDRMKKDAGFQLEMAERKVMDSLNWIAKSHVDAILVTCTFFTSLLHDNHFPVPVVKIDEPLFQDACGSDQPIVFVFTNPDTVDGTVKQFTRFTEKRGVEKQIETRLIPNSFELLMQGRSEQYLNLVSNELVKIIEENPRKWIIASQLSMVPAAKHAEALKSTHIGNPLVSLSQYMEGLLGLQVKQM